MGSAASAIVDASVDDVRKALQGLSADDRKRIEAALAAVPASAAVEAAPELVESFWSAVQGDNADQAKAILQQSPELVNSANEDKFTALGYACLEGHARVASVLLATSGINVNLRQTGMMVTPLFLAATNGFDDIVEMLLRVDVIDINAGLELCPEDQLGDSDEARLQCPVVAAANGRDPEQSLKIIKQLLARGDLDIGGESGERIKFALEKANSQCVDERGQLIKFLEDHMKVLGIENEASVELGDSAPTFEEVKKLPLLRIESLRIIAEFAEKGGNLKVMQEAKQKKAAGEEVDVQKDWDADIWEKIDDVAYHIEQYLSGGIVGGTQEELLQLMDRMKKANEEATGIKLELMPKETPI